jgi:alpha-glucosidase
MPGSGEPGRRDGAKADWYVWADPKPDGAPPNNWLSVFGGGHGPGSRGGASTTCTISLDSRSSISSSRGRGRARDVARFWLDRGVDGFRLDAIDSCSTTRCCATTRRAIRCPIRRRPGRSACRQHRYDMLQPETYAFMTGCAP